MLLAISIFLAAQIRSQRLKLKRPPKEPRPSWDDDYAARLQAWEHEERAYNLQILEAADEVWKALQHSDHPWVTGFMRAWGELTGWTASSQDVIRDRIAAGQEMAVEAPFWGPPDPPERMAVGFLLSLSEGDEGERPPVEVDAIVLPILARRNMLIDPDDAFGLACGPR